MLGGIAPQDVWPAEIDVDIRVFVRVPLNTPVASPAKNSSSSSSPGSDGFKTALSTPNAADPATPTKLRPDCLCRVCERMHSLFSRPRPEMRRIELTFYKVRLASFNTRLGIV